MYKTLILLFSLFLTLSNSLLNSGKEYWYDSARRALDKRFQHSKLHTHTHTHVHSNAKNAAKNVVIFIGDGMGMSTLTAARILKSENTGKAYEDTELVWDTFPAVALVKTSNADAQIGESSACATALMCGVKANYETVGVDSRVTFDDCDNTFASQVPSLATWAQRAGKATGIVTNTRLTHATPAALYAHSPNRYWEDDSKVGIGSRTKCKDIARQLLEDEPGTNFKVMLGGGRRHFTSITSQDPEEPHKEGKRLDGRNLIEDWIRAKQRQGRNVSYVTNKQQLDNAHPNTTDQLLGLFSHSHMEFNIDRDTSLRGDPSLTEMTLKALEFVQQEENGYLLVVEGGRIDHAHHYNNAYRALDETLSLENAVTETLNRVNLTETLVIVTTDHSHVFILAGNPTKTGNSISGTRNDPLVTEGNLFYANGPGGMKKLIKSRNMTLHKNTIQRSVISIPWATHAGEDVPLYAIGAWSSEIFSGTVEQSYIPHAIAYVTCTGHYKGNCNQHQLHQHQLHQHQLHQHQLHQHQLHQHQLHQHQLHQHQLHQHQLHQHQLHQHQLHQHQLHQHQHQHHEYQENTSHSTRRDYTEGQPVYSISIQEYVEKLQNHKTDPYSTIVANQVTFSRAVEHKLHFITLLTFLLVLIND